MALIEMTVEDLIKRRTEIWEQFLPGSVIEELKEIEFLLVGGDSGNYDDTK